jgi:DNA polymerase sigma
MVQLLLDKELERINSELIYTYMQLDPRVRHLCLLVKAWNKQKFVNLLMRLNSYSLVLMMIAYLQLKGYLPYLQDLSASVPESERRTLSFKKYLLKKGKNSSKQN